MRMTAREFAPGLLIRSISPPLRLADFKLVAFDMDSTLINIECVDEIAEAAGRRAEVAAITEATMRGEITDYKESLRRRVALLAGVPEAALHEVYSKHLQLNPGVERFVQACQAAGLKTLLVSGGLPSSANACGRAWGSTSRVPMCWSLRPGSSPGGWLTGRGATSSMGRKSGASCSKCAS